MDLILLHPPSVYDFRKLNIFWGPISDGVPSTSIFELYPLGWVSIVDYLERFGYQVRIINLAVKMLEDKNFDVEGLIKKLKPTAFGIDLHWLVHAHGSIEVAKIVKKYHPHIPTILGGFSASYYHEEIIRNYPHIDYIVRGDSTEKVLIKLLRAIKNKEDLTEVPNLTWRNRRGEIMINPTEFVPTHLDDLWLDYKKIIKSVIKYKDPWGYAPFVNWWRYPITAVLIGRGCYYNCPFCGGSNYANQLICQRKKPAFRPPYSVVQDIETIQKYINAPIFIIGDLCHGGEDYAKTFLRELKKIGVKNELAFEFFSTPNKELLGEIALCVPRFNIEISPESHDEEIRRLMGRNYSNEELEEFISTALKLGTRRLDIFFTVGLPKQTSQSAFATIDYAESLLVKFGKRINTFIAPLAPFIDPGSILFEEPEKFGYKLFYKTLEEHRRALLNPTWQYVLNYETEWMDRRTIMETTYEAASKLALIKAEHGLFSKREARRVEKKIILAKKVEKALNDGLKGSKLEKDHLKLLNSIKNYHLGITCNKKELEWPKKLLSFNLTNIALLKLQESAFWRCLSSLFNHYLSSVLLKKRRPFVANLRLTSTCDKNLDSLDFTKVKAILETLYQRGNRLLVIMGDEPFLWQDKEYGLVDVVALAKRYFLSVCVITNGTFPLDLPADVIWVNISKSLKKDGSLSNPTLDLILENIKRSGHHKIFVHLAIGGFDPEEITELIKFFVGKVKGITVELNDLDEPLHLEKAQQKEVFNRIILLKKEGYPILNSIKTLVTIKNPSQFCLDWLIDNVEPDGKIRQGCHGKTRGIVNICEKCNYLIHSEISLAYQGTFESILAIYRIFFQK
ncbi:TPA: TIGR04190 family B12-binding domain/radical SAM domain protein [bacterium]|nr:TIGR04190 family B12-binding domain/radical SAM domain protein [bacterium]